MDYLDQFAQDEQHMEIGEMIDEEEKAEDRNFMMTPYLFHHILLPFITELTIF